MSSNTRFILLVLILIAGVVAAMLIVPRLTRSTLPNENTLNLGTTASTTEIDIVIRPPIELDFMTKAEVLQLRREAVHWYPALFTGEYRPAESIFGQIVDGLPWWGIAG
jgi:hypothetical protein